MKIRTLRHASRGFTLLEMMVVLLIIGLLMGVVVYNIAGQGASAKRKATVIKMAQIDSVLTQYNLEYSGYPPTLDVLVEKKLLKEVPRDSWNRTFIYFPNTGGIGDGKPFTLYSKGETGEETGDNIVDWWKEKQQPQENR